MMKLHIFTTIVIGICIASAGLFLEAIGQTTEGRRSVYRPPLYPAPPPAIKRLCQADGLYLVHELAIPVGQIRAQGCEQITLEHISDGYFLAAGVRTDVGEGVY